MHYNEQRLHVSSLLVALFPLINYTGRRQAKHPSFSTPLRVLTHIYASPNATGQSVTSDKQQEDRNKRTVAEGLLRV